MKNIILSLIALIAILNSVTVNAQYLPTDEQIETIAKVSASNQFADIGSRLEKIYKSPSDRANAEKIANVDEFVKLGGNADPSFRLCLRNFEPVTSATRSMNLVDYNLLEKIGFGLPISNSKPVDYAAKSTTRKGTLCVSIGFIICASYGEEIGSSHAFNPGVEFDKTKYEEAKSILKDLRNFASNSNFQKLLKELYTLPASKQSQFVKEQILNKTSLTKRGIVLPKDILIMRSAFADNRPTLICLVKYKADGISNLTITFDSGI